MGLFPLNTYHRVPDKLPGYGSPIYGTEFSALICNFIWLICLQWFDAVGWVAGKASGL